MASTQAPSLINIIQFFVIKDLLDLEMCQVVEMAKLQNEITKLDLKKCNQIKKRGFCRGEGSPVWYLSQQQSSGAERGALTRTRWSA